MEVLGVVWSGANSPCLMLFQQVFGWAGPCWPAVTCEACSSGDWRTGDSPGEDRFFSKLDDNSVTTTLGPGFFSHQAVWVLLLLPLKLDRESFMKKHS